MLFMSRMVSMSFLGKGISRRFNVTSYSWSQIICYIVVLKVLKPTLLIIYKCVGMRDKIEML